MVCVCGMSLCVMSVCVCGVCGVYVLCVCVYGVYMCIVCVCAWDNSYQQGTIDLGAYVDALGKSVLRIHNIAVQMSDSTGRTSEVTSSGSAPFNGAAAQFQLLTQSQVDIVLASNKSVISSGRLICSGNGEVPTYVSHDFDNLPQLWTNGYLVAVDSIFLGGAASTGFDGDVYCTVVMECTVETMSQAAAMALALSQQ